MKVWLSLYLLCQVSVVLSDQWKTKHTELNGACSFTSYQPGRKEVTILTVTAPTAEVQKTVLSAIFTHAQTDDFIGTVGLSAEVVSLAGELATKFASTASKLAPCLGIFSGAMSMFMSDMTPTPDDILKATNKAIEKLAEQVNDRLEEMRVYVDERVIDLEKDLVERRYKFHFTYWAECIKANTKERVNNCQAEAYRLMSASLGEIALFYDKMDSTGSLVGLSNDDVRRIEVNLISFRDYVQLSVMVLKTLAESYKTDASTREMYETELVDKTAFYDRYATAAYNAIADMNVDFGTKLVDTYQCDEAEVTDEHNYHVRQVTTACRCVLAPVFIANRCSVSITVVQKDVDFPGRGFTTVEVDTTEFRQVGAVYGKTLFRNAQGRLASATRTAVRTYWNSETLDVIRCAKLLVEGRTCP